MVKTSPSNAGGVWVLFPGQELRSHVPRGQKAKNIEQKQYCSKFNKDFFKKMVQGLPWWCSG